MWSEDEWGRLDMHQTSQHQERKTCIYIIKQNTYQISLIYVNITKDNIKSFSSAVSRRWTLPTRRFELDWHQPRPWFPGPRRFVSWIEAIGMQLRALFHIYYIRRAILFGNYFFPVLGIFFGFLFPCLLLCFLLFCFSLDSAFMLLCFSASPLFCFSAFAFLLFFLCLLLCFSASPLFCFSAVFCFFASQASLNKRKMHNKDTP